MVSINDLKKKPLHVSDRPWVEWLKLFGLQSASLLTVGAFLLPFDTPLKYTRLTLRLVGSGLAIASIAQTRKIQYADKYWRFREVMREDDFLQMQAEQMQQDYAQQQAIAQMPEAALSTEINWGSVVTSPHLGIVGKTGSGKSALTQWMASQLHGDIAVYDSDAAPHEWQGLNVVGRGANYPAIAAAMEADLEELQRRTEARARGEESYQPLIRILEESPETLSALKDNNFDVGYRWLKGILRRGRKYKIKLILLSQGFSVKSLKIEGEGELRDNIAVLRLGKVAIAHAKTACDPYQFELLKQQSRPVLIEEELIGSVPDLSGFLVRTKVAHSPHPAHDLHTTRTQLEAIYNKPCTQMHTDEVGGVHCPKCESKNVRTNGTNRKGNTRYRCKDCGKSWSH